MLKLTLVAIHDPDRDNGKINPVVSIEGNATNSDLGFLMAGALRGLIATLLPLQEQTTSSFALAVLFTLCGIDPDRVHQHDNLNPSNSIPSAERKPDA